MKQNPTLNCKADYIEHRFEARAMLSPIFDALRNRLFCFWKSNNLPHELEYLTQVFIFGRDLWEKKARI